MLKTAELKKCSIDKWRALINEVDCFSVEHNNLKFLFEVHVLKTDAGVKVMVECARATFFLSFFGKHKYFSVNHDGLVKDMSGDEFWDSEFKTVTRTRT